MNNLNEVFVLTHRGICDSIKMKIVRLRIVRLCLNYRREVKIMPTNRWIAVCQWCGKRGGTAYSNTSPSYTPVVSGKCEGHPSGKPNMPHNPRWERG